MSHVGVRKGNESRQDGVSNCLRRVLQGSSRLRPGEIQGRRGREWECAGKLGSMSSIWSRRADPRTAQVLHDWYIGQDQGICTGILCRADISSFQLVFFPSSMRHPVRQVVAFPLRISQDSDSHTGGGVCFARGLCAKVFDWPSRRQNFDLSVTQSSIDW